MFLTPTPVFNSYHLLAMLDDPKRIEIAKALEDLAAQETWNSDVWQQCYDLVGANAKKDDLLGYVHDDLVHYTGRPLFRSAPLPKDLNLYRQGFRDVATALRARMSLADYRKKYE
jgi:hypothetical protein